MRTERKERERETMNLYGKQEERGKSKIEEKAITVSNLVKLLQRFFNLH